MKVILDIDSKAKSKSEMYNILTEDVLMNPTIANEKLSKHNLYISKVEEVNGEKVFYIKENKSNILLG